MLSRKARRAQREEQPALSRHSSQVMEVAEASAQLSRIPTVVVDRLRSALVENESLNDQVLQMRKQVKKMQGLLFVVVVVDGMTDLIFRGTRWPKDERADHRFAETAQEGSGYVDFSIYITA